MLAIAIVIVACALPASAYDFASACTRPYRSTRAHAAPDAPCDLTKHAYCATPGSSYPWQAIRRFVRENQGLMRRMYGEERHISVLKAELDNFIEDDDLDSPPDFAEDIIKTKMMYSKRGRAMKDKPHFRPIQSSDKKKVENDSLRVKPLDASGNSTKLNRVETGNKTSSTNNGTQSGDKGISYKTKLESIAHIEINNLDPDVITLDAVIKQSIETNSIYPNNSDNSKSEALRGGGNNNTTTESDKNITLTTEPSMNATETTTVDQYDDTTTESDKGGWKAMNPVPDASTLPPTLLFSEHEKVKVVDRVDTKVNDKKEEPPTKPTHQQEKIRPSVIKLRGANACETKEELLAPFWANNTRGEKLVLVNMYPYEQYIHLETCVHERKQMYCREGCRCEQHYRLHRLLAFDPHNPCRGIFSDWFKFPACCVCRCYDVPLEFRARSPRLLPPQYGEDVKRIIYEDVARDWYSMTAYGDDEDYDLL
ncbi:protein spaetzle 4 isoform X1 [Ostrinia nubilalis]|uniref:protein spaetzle 4 isoform X1 n=1 Tax=Ostrinia nubilalis TaxID=29057 RepID=UPI0030824263